MVELTYPEVGASTGLLPPGYHHLVRRAVIGVGAAEFTDAADRLMTWRMHRGAGVYVDAPFAQVVEGADALLRLGRGPFTVTAPVRVVAVIDDERRRGFVYGTLPGHPECGEESFVVEHGQDDQVVLTIRAFSRPATRLARAAGPLGRLVQRVITRRYVRAFDPVRASSLTSLPVGSSAAYDVAVR